MRLSSTPIGFVLVCALLLAAAPLASAQDPEPTEPAQEPEAGGSEAPYSQAFFLDATPYEGDNVTFQEPVFTLSPAAGTPTSPPTGCSLQGGHPMQAVAHWVSPPISEYGITFVGSIDVPVSVGAGSASQPVSSDAVEMQLTFAAGDGGAHPIAQGGATIRPDSVPGVAVGPLPASATITLESANHTIPEGLPLVMTLSIGCGQSDFTLELGQMPEFPYFIGDPSEEDTDGDGIPDSLDSDADGDGFLDDEELAVGSDSKDAGVTPASTHADCPGFTYSEVFEETGDPNTCPDTGGFPILALILILLVIVLLGGAGAGAYVVVNKRIKMTVSHDGFQALEKGQSAEYELTLMATGKKEEEVPVELTLKGVPEDWSASLEPSHLTLMAGEAAEAQTALLRLTPPPGEEHEAEAQVTVTATPTDEEGKTSAMKPGTSTKTKTIVNIGVTPPEGEGKKKKPKKEKKEKGAAEETEAAEGEDAPKKKGLGGMLKRKKKGDEDTEAEEEAEEKATEAAAEEPAAGAAAAAPASPPAGGKPSVAMGKMVHDPADFSAGDAVTTTVTVRNKGDGPVEGLTLSLYVNDQRADQKAVDLAPGDSTEVTFKWTAQPDENRVRLKGSMKGA